MILIALGIKDGEMGENQQLARLELVCIVWFSFEYIFDHPPPDIHGNYRDTERIYKSNTAVVKFLYHPILVAMKLMINQLLTAKLILT